MKLPPLTLLLSLLALVCAAGPLGGCGGGAGGVAGPVPDAVVLGKVVSVDGSTAQLHGVQVATSDGSSQATTDGAGTFRLEVRSGERLRIRFDDPNTASASDRDVEEGEDDTPDGSDIDGDEVEIEELGEGETCEIEVELRDGEVVEAWVNRNREDGPHFEAQARLVPPEDADNQDARGEVEIECGASCCRAEIEVAGLTGPDIVEIVLWHPEGDEVSLGIIEVNAEGSGHWVAEACWETGEGSGDAPSDGDGGASEKGDGENACEVPFGEETLGDLKGVRLLLVDGLGNVVLVGEMPGDGAQHDDEDHCHALTELLPPDGSNEPDAEGVALLKRDDGCEKLVIEVGGFDATALMQVYVEGPEGSEALLGQMELGDKGMGRLYREYCPGDELPFGVESMTALGGNGLILTNGDGVVLLQGEFPTLPADGDCGEDGDDDHGDDEWRAADGSLAPPDGSPEPDAEGWILVKVRTEACLMVIEVGGIAETAALDVVIVHPEGDEAIFGEFAIHEEGGGRFARDGCDELPFEASTLEDLGGYGVQLVDGEGRVVLAGVVPTFGD
jgi:hypothetical protein